MYGTLDILTSGLVAQRTRLDTISANILNKDSLMNDRGEFEPYRRRMAILAQGDPVSGRPEGVHVTEIAIDMAPLTPRHDPGSPFADADGYVLYPNVHLPMEQLNAMEAARAYEANIAAIEATKSMLSVALQILA
jgi:flagellar basal-body rod protein FlgC